MDIGAIVTLTGACLSGGWSCPAIRKMAIQIGAGDAIETEGRPSARIAKALGAPDGFRQASLPSGA